MSDYNHRVTVQAPTESRSGSGAVTVVWDEFGTRWAHIEMSQGREFFLAKQSNVEINALMEMPGYMAVTTKMRVVHDDGRKWDILAVISKDGKAPVNAETLVLHCKEGIRSGS